MRPPVKISASRERGLNTVVPAGSMEYLSLDLLVLGAGDGYELDSAGVETVAVMLKGSVMVVIDGEGHRLKRKDVFSDTASALVIPNGSSAAFQADAASEIALCRAKTDMRGNVVRIGPEGVREKMVGRDIWRRRVVDIVGPEADASRIVLGETFNEPGGWSSFPPHKHDVFMPGVEAKMEEIYLFRVEPSYGFGTQTIYGRDDLPAYSFNIRDYDAVTIPWGYHPVSAMPGVRLYYLWFLAGEGRVLQPNTDPRFKWLEGK